MTKTRGKSKDTAKAQQTTSAKEPPAVPERAITIYREPVDETQPREERGITDGEWHSQGDTLTAEGWYRADEAPIINPMKPLTVLRNDPDDASAIPQQRVITHGDWVTNHDSYQGEGWYRADEKHSSSRPTGS